MNYTLKVAEIRQETKDTVTLCFKQPGLKKIKYLAGQYLTLIFRINGRRYIRPYSFSSCPDVDSYLEITIKRIANGIVSNYVNDVVKVGDSIEVMSPMGDFIFKAAPDLKSVYLWGVGSGITPLISIAKHILHTNYSIVVHLIYGNRNPENTIFLAQIEALREKYPNNFITRKFFSRSAVNENNPYLIQGRINQNRAVSILNEDPNFINSSHYICGPSGLKESVKAALTSKNINHQLIFSEDFELVKDPKDFEDIYTQNVVVNFNGENYKIEVTKGKSVLEAALDNDLDLPYSCQTGSCNSCKSTLLSGELKTIGISNKREDLNDNEFLLCCTYPLSENVKVKI